ncbi:VRR-NUC domain-containing protein [Culicoidibacter larvae]|uniref:VRR-NUC domain-containing protein n=1 Tax=Culicoidibacter larvae TaxID=2579976 RepID=A0A5R8Q971_9FIRM|nr:VRR-NUC domain-containing protein [Culicoidibacter larvae]TLG71389.1 VRR-NUC domain-containing protein [Culicoidibacter larvae]
MLESQIEKYLMKQVRNIGGLCYKWVSPGNNGVPDRIVLYKGKVWFVEVKRPTGKTRKLQDYVINQINQQGCCALVLNTKTKIDYFIEKLEAM